MIGITIIASIATLCSSETTYLSEEVVGKSTYYGGNPSGGACGYADVPISTFPFGYYAACGGTVFDGGKGCGKCFEITCIGPASHNPGCHCDPETPSVIISCMDQCPECDATHFDLDPTSMARIVGDGLSGTCGIIETRVRKVSCDYTGNIKIRAKSGTSAYWYGLHIDDVAGYGSITSVRLKSSGTSNYGTTCTKDGGPSYWGCSGGFPLSAPLTVELTNDNGDILELNNCIKNFNGGAEFDCGANFGSSGGPSPATAPTDPPVDTTNCDGSTLKVENHEDSSLYWMALYLLDVCESCGEITKVEIKDNNNYQSWYAATDSIRGSKLYYSFDNNGNAFTAPLSVRVTNGDGSIIITNAITSITGQSTVDSGTNICDSGSNPVTSSTSQPTTTTTTTTTTKAPTQSNPVSSPTPKPTTTTTTTRAPTAATVCGGNTLKIQNHASSQQWWMALFIDDACESCGDITSVAIKDNGNYQSWYAATDSIRGSRLYYSFNNNGQSFSLPISVQITNSQGSIVVTNAITSFSGEGITDSGTNICVSNGAFAVESDRTNDGAANWTIWFVIIFSLLVFIGCVVGFVVYMKRRQKGDVAFTETEIGDNAPKINEDSREIEVEAEIEVEMNVNHTQTNITRAEDSD